MFFEIFEIKLGKKKSLKKKTFSRWCIIIVSQYHHSHDKEKKPEELIYWINFYSNQVVISGNIHFSYSKFWKLNIYFYSNFKTRKSNGVLYQEQFHQKVSCQLFQPESTQDHQVSHSCWNSTPSGNRKRKVALWWFKTNCE